MDCKQTADFLMKQDNILVLTHKNPDGDTIGSAAALTRALRLCGKNAAMFDNDGIYEKLMEYAGPYIAGESFRYDVIVSADVADETMFANNFNGGSIVLAIDHHPTNPGFGENNCIYPEKSATGEIILEIIENLPCKIDQETATLLYLAVSTDTGCFKYAKTNSETFLAVSKLLDYGAANLKINEQFFRKVSKARLALEGMIYSGMEYYYDDKIVVVTITQEMLRKSGATDNDMDDIAGIPGRAETEYVGVVIRELEDKRCKVSLRSVPEINSFKVCESFGGGGHAVAAGCTVDESVPRTKELILEKIIELWP